MKNKIFIISPDFENYDGISTFSKNLLNGMRHVYNKDYEILKFDTNYYQGLI